LWCQVNNWKSIWIHVISPVMYQDWKGINIWMLLYPKYQISQNGNITGIHILVKKTYVITRKLVSKLDRQ
jgi:hypothetical protein